MTDTHPKPVRHSRRGLVTPFVIVGLLMAGWTGWWFSLAKGVETRLEAQVARLQADGWRVEHAPVVTTGWPFRARLSIPHVRVIAPSGHGVAAPELVAEANAWNPDRWVAVAPNGLTLIRADKGEVGVGGDGLRLSVSHLRERFPDLRLEMIRPVFTTHLDADPFPIASAERVQFYARPHLTDSVAATDELDVKFMLTGARGRPDGPVEAATGQGRLSADLEATIVGASHLRGLDSAGVFSNWTESGGRFDALRGELRIGDTRARLSSETLSAGPDGRLTGEVAVRAEQPLAAIAGLAGSRSGAVNRTAAAGAAAAAAASGGRGVDLVVQFRGGRTWLGPFALAPAPKLF